MCYLNVSITLDVVIGLKSHIFMSSVSGKNARFCQYAFSETILVNIPPNSSYKRLSQPATGFLFW